MNTWCAHPISLLFPISEPGLTRAMTRNEAKYANPERFQPERFLHESGELVDNTMGYTFGAGRRICVGRHIADASLWSAFVSILAIFRITPCKDEQGNDIRVEPRWTVGVTSYALHASERRLASPHEFIRHVFFFFVARHPLPFPCKFVLRASSGLTAEKLAQCSERHDLFLLSRS